MEIFLIVYCIAQTVVGENFNEIGESGAFHAKILPTHIYILKLRVD